jgi:hypothetical protein
MILPPLLSHHISAPRQRLHLAGKPRQQAGPRGEHGRGRGRGRVRYAKGSATDSNTAACLRGWRESLVPGAEYPIGHAHTCKRR